MATRWGICSTGMIANDFCAALKSLPSSEHEVVAVAGRQKESASKFAEKFGIPAAYGSYEELAKDPNVEIVYVGTIPLYHFSACMLFLDHGKHVLCEKPLTMNLHDCKTLLATAREKKLFFMEGVWTRFFPALHKIQEVLKEGSLGDINFLRATFCVPAKAQSLERMWTKNLGGGGMLELGCYLVQYANVVFQELPESVTVVGKLSEEGVDQNGTLMLKYKGGAIAVLLYSIDGVFGHNTLTIYGSKKNLQVEDSCHCPIKVTMSSGETLEFPLPESPYNYIYNNSQGLMYQAAAVRECLQQGLLECPQMTHEDSINIMIILEEALRQLGINYSSQS